MMEDACWLAFCCCMGLGCGPFMHQSLRARCCCLKCEADDTECGGPEGCLSCISTCCLCHALCHLPPRHRSPPCICWGEAYGLVHKAEGQEERDEKELEEDHCTGDIYNTMLEEAFTVCYARVLGC